MSSVTLEHCAAEAPLHSNLAAFVSEHHLPFYRRDGATVVTLPRILSCLCDASCSAVSLLGRALHSVVYLGHIVRVLLPLDVLVTAALLACQGVIGRRSNYITDWRMASVYLAWYPYFTLGTFLKLWGCLSCLCGAWRILFGQTVVLSCGIADFVYTCLSLLVWYALYTALPSYYAEGSGGPGGGGRRPKPPMELIWDTVEDFGGWEEEFPVDGKKEEQEEEEEETKEPRKDEGEEDPADKHLDFNEEIAAAIKAALKKECRRCAGKDVKCTDSSAQRARLKLKKTRRSAIKRVYYAIFSRAPKGKRRYNTSK